MDTHVQSQGSTEHGTPYIFFVDDREFTIHQPTITGGQIMDIAGIPRENGLIEILPDGTQQKILDVPDYDFHWQTYYMFAKPLEIPAGAKLVSSAWYDNSATNPANPDPKATVKWGDQTWDEMQYTGLLFSPALKNGQTQQNVKK